MNGAPQPQRRFRAAMYVLLTLIMLLVAAALTAVWYAQPLLRGVIERELGARLVPAVRIAGPVQWQVFPELSLKLRDVVLSDEDGQTLLVLAEVSVQVDREALLRGTLVLPSIVIDGLDLRVRRDDTSRWRLAGWLRASDDPAPGTLVPIGKLRIHAAKILIDDDVPLTLSELHVEVGPLNPGEAGSFDLSLVAERPEPFATRLRVALSGAFAFADAGLRLEGLAGDVDGTASVFESVRGTVSVQRIGVAAEDGLRIEGVELDLEATGADARIAARASIDTLGGVDGTLVGEGLKVDAQVRHAQWTVSGRLVAPDPVLRPEHLSVPSFELAAVSSGQMAIALDLAAALEVAGGEIVLDAGRGRVELPHPSGGESPLVVSFRADARWVAGERAGEGHIAGDFDDSRFDGRWRYAPDESLPVHLELALDRLDADRYMPAPTDDRGPADLTVWRNWPVSAELRVGELRIQGFVSTDAKLDLRGREPTPTQSP